jgi:hypothetical protein
MKQFFYNIGCIGLAALLMVSLSPQEGGAYQFSPKSLKIRYVKTVYLPVLQFPVYRKVTENREYMLCSLWDRLHILPETEIRSEGRASLCEPWIDVLTWKPGQPSIEGPAYRLFDITTVGSPEYWKEFSEAYPREAKRLFRRIIRRLGKGDIQLATRLLTENAWMPISA